MKLHLVTYRIDVLGITRQYRKEFSHERLPAHCRET